MLVTVQKSLEEQQQLGIEDDDEEEELNQELEEVTCQIETVKNKLEKLGPETTRVSS
jgi:predicted nuclease with TOPRIM domain